MTFPTTLYHKERAPEGQVFMTEDDVPTEGGWVDTPAAFVAGYKAPAPVVPAGELPADAPAGFVKQSYPSHRYKVGDPDNPKTVASQEEDDALEAAEPGVWKHSPDPTAKVNAKPGPDAGAPNPSALADLVPGADDAPVALSDAQKADVHNAKAADLFVKLSGIGSKSLLSAIAAAENERPAGARSTVLKAVKARIAELNVSAE